jgi:hypothetical protein
MKGHVGGHEDESRGEEPPPPLVDYMAGESREARSAAFLRTYAARVRNGTAASWEIPNTVATTIEDIAAILESKSRVEEPTPHDCQRWRHEGLCCRLCSPIAREVGPR